MGRAKGAPEPTSMSFESLLARMQSEEAWIEKYKRLPYENQQGKGIKKQYKEKKMYLMELNLELMKKGIELRGDTPDEVMIQIIKKSISLMKNGADPDEAFEIAKKPLYEKIKMHMESGMAEEDAVATAKEEYVSGALSQ